MENHEAFAPFLSAFQKNDRAGFMCALEQNAAGLIEQDKNGSSLLLALCCQFTGQMAIPPVWGSERQLDMIRFVCQAGAELNAENRDGWKPLHVAAISGHCSLAQLLMDAGASLEGQLMGTANGSPLALALFYAKTEVAKLLANPPTPANLRHAAALGQDLDPFWDGHQLKPQALIGLDFYRPIPAFPVWDRSLSCQEVLDEALTWAARNNQIDAMQTLVDWGADINNNVYRGTPLLWAIYADRVEAAAWLLDHGADPDLRHDFGGSEHGKSAVAMHLAAQYNGVKCLRLLLERGADHTIRDAAYDGTPLDWAEFGEAKEAAEILRNANQTH